MKTENVEWLALTPVNFMNN